MNVASMRWTQSSRSGNIFFSILKMYISRYENRKYVVAAFQKARVPDNGIQCREDCVICPSDAPVHVYHDGVLYLFLHGFGAKGGDCF